MWIKFNFKGKNESDNTKNEKKNIIKPDSKDYQLWFNNKEQTEEETIF